MLTAWLNLPGLVTVLGAINVGTCNLFIGAFGSTLGIESSFGLQAAFVIGITSVRAVFNHVGIRATARLTDLSGYPMFITAVLLTVCLLAHAPSLDFLLLCASRGRRSTTRSPSARPGSLRPKWPWALRSRRSRRSRR